MSPRKRARPNPSDGSAATQSETSATSQPPLSSPTSGSGDKAGMPPPKREDQSANTPTSNGKDKRVRNSRSWYGSWSRPSKTSASTSIARETANGGTARSGASADFSRFETRKAGSGNDSDAQSVTSMQKITETDSPSQRDASIPAKTPSNPPNQGNGVTDSQNSTAPTEPGHVDAPVETEPIAQGRWLPWLGRSAAQGQSPENSQKESEVHKTETTQDVLSQPRISPDVSAPTRPANSSWFGLWPAATQNTMQNVTQEAKAQSSIPVQSAAKTGEDAAMQDTEAPKLGPPAASKGQQPSAGSTWAFWSRETTKPATIGAKSPEQGELAVMGDISETSPAVGVEVDKNVGNSGDPTESLAGRGSSRVKSKKDNKRDNKRERPLSAKTTETVAVESSTHPAESSNLTTKLPNSLPNKQTPPNLLLPSFRNTYHLKENPSILEQITQLLLRTQQPSAKHVFLSKEPPRVKKAIAIGVHGLFPASFLRPMIGQPTGTSLRFASHGAEAIRRWADSQGCGDCEIEKVALEGEGKIAERVDNLWKLLLNWIDHIRSADLILIACHSQGVPVSVMLLAKLIELGVVNSSRIGVCAMAGVSLGPFPDYTGMGMIMGTAAELWQLADPESVISKRYQESLKTIINRGARITYVGSIDDQLVPLESALFGPASHPYIYRAVFIDGRLHAPDFIAHLIGFALKLRNLGVSDHGLIRELSVALAGSLYTGEGHSRLYDDEQVYDLAVSHTLETTSVLETPCLIQKHQGLNNPNPYVLPWIMRGLLEEDFVKTELYSETVELLKQFDEWTPATKALKDVKYRLEAVRSKL